LQELVIQLSRQRRPKPRAELTEVEAVYRPVSIKVEEAQEIGVAG
jgi:hypothetical protein